MQLIGRLGIDVAIIPIGDLFTMGPEDSIQATQWIQPRFVLPTHYDTWPPIAQDAQNWADLIRRDTKAQRWCSLWEKPGNSGLSLSVIYPNREL